MIERCSKYLFDHADGETFLEAAELAAVAPPLVDGAVAVGQTHILGAFLNGPLEESLAALAGADAVVLTGRVVPAHPAQLRRRLGPPRRPGRLGFGPRRFRAPHGVHHTSANQVHSEILQSIHQSESGQSETCLSLARQSHAHQHDPTSRIESMLTYIQL